jgi:hypothetical protein
VAGCQHDLPATATTAARRCYHWTVALALLALGKRRCTGRCLQVGAVPGPKSAGASSCPQSLAVQGGTGSRFTVRKFRNSIQELPSRAPEFPDRAPELPDGAPGISELPAVGDMISPRAGSSEIPGAPSGSSGARSRNSRTRPGSSWIEFRSSGSSGRLREAATFACTDVKDNHACPRRIGEFRFRLN